MSEVVVFGSAIVDFICYVERLPKPGETLHGTRFATGFGGKGANQCVAAARLGAKASMIAKVGDDSWGSDYVQQLRKECINVEFVEQCKEQTTGIAQIAVSAAGQNHIVIVVGANNLLSDADVKKAKTVLDSAKILICQLETPPSATLTALNSFKGISILNAAPAMENTPVELLRAATIFCVNETEAALMIKSGDVSTIEESKTACAALLKMGANTVIITLGAQGAVYAAKKDPGTVIHVPVPSAVDRVVDTTGAGDAFIGSLAFFVARYPHLPMHQHIGAACAYSACTVQKPGTQASFPSATEFNTDITQQEYQWHKI